MDSSEASWRIHNTGSAVQLVATSRRNGVNGDRISLVSPRLSLTVGCGITTLIAVFISTVVPLSDTAEKSNYASFAGYSIQLAVVGCFMYAIGTSRIVGVGGRLVVYNLWLSRELPITTVQVARVESGLEVVADGGRVIGCTGYGSSLVQGIFGSKRYTRAADRINRWIQTVRDPGQPTSSTIRSRVRPALFPGIFAWLAIGLCYTSLVWALASTLRPLFGIST
jgi:hypothetical protein